MPLIRRFLTVLLLLFAGTAAAQDEPAPADLALFVFDGDLPAAGVGVEVDGQPRARTNSNGAAWLLVPAGEHTLTLYRGDGRTTEVTLAIEPGENMRVIATLPKAPTGGQPVVDIQSSKGSDALASMSAESMEGPTGTLTGRVVNSEDGGPVAGARVFVSGTPVDVQTDQDGRFSAELPAGTYAVSVIHGDYSTQTRDGLEVAAGETTRTSVELTPAGLELKEFVVTVPFIEGSVASSISTQKESAQVTEVLGASQMSQAGDSDAADTVSRVTGLTIEDGKYVIIRGQPSRYSFTTWNRSPLPSPDPIKRIVPLDLFPTGTLSSLEVQKSYSADKPGEFGAGLIALNTKGVPEGPVAEVSVGAGYDSRATGKDALTFKGGNEILGDAGSDLRMPGPVDDATNGGDDSLNLLDPAIKGDLAQSFPNRWSPESTTFPADHSLSLTLGDRFSLWGGEYGVLGSFSWSRDYEITEESEKGFDEGLAVETDYDRTKYDQNIDLGGMLVIGGEWGENHKVTSNSFFIRKTKKRVQVEDGFNFTSESRFEKNFLLEWNQREMFAQQLIGDHQLPWFHLDWRGLIASSNRLSPDRRQYKLFETGGEFEIYDQLGGLRRYNETTSNTNSYQLSLDRDWLDNDTWKLNTELGAFQSGMDRESKAATFQFFPTEATDTDVPEEAFDPAKVPDSMDLRSFPQSSADYEGTKSIQAFFGQVTTTWNDLLRFVAGARNETSELDVTTFSAFAPDGVDSGYEQTNTLKTLSATWFMNETMQVRAAYGESLSHPLLVELSDTGYFHPDTGEVHRGNPDLEPAEITGYDLRWEWYPSEEESLSLGYFRKAYTNPIETVFIPLAGGGEQITKDNADSATVSGYEASVRIGLGPLATGVDWLEPAYLRANGALIDSQVDYGGDPGLVTNPERPLQGQADQIINIQLGYSTDAVNYALVYNRVGERLAQVGNKGEPDIYRDPLTTVDLVASWRLGEHWSVKFKGENLTQPDIVFTQGDKTQKTVSQSRSFSLELKWAL